jgi:hypothetical protein
MQVQDSYIQLIQSFLDQTISVQEFERSYIDKFLEEEIPLGELYEPLNWLFSEVDAYTDDPQAFIDDPDDYITEEQLRVSAAKTLGEIKALNADS